MGKCMGDGKNQPRRPQNRPARGVDGFLASESQEGQLEGSTRVISDKGQTGEKGRTAFPYRKDGVGTSIKRF
jgi:hypothetical protein